MPYANSQRLRKERTRSLFIEVQRMGGPRGILVFGANGSGKTTLGRELARVLSAKHLDEEKYRFEKSGIPYTVERSNEECLRLMLADIEAHENFVVSAVRGDFGELISSYYKLAVYLAAPLDMRLERIQWREHERHGARIREGGDMYESNQRFIEFVASRSPARVDEWAATLTCPLLRVDGAVDWRVSAAQVAEVFRGLP